MSTNNTSILNGRILRMSLSAVVAVILLAGAAYVWGTALHADVSQSTAPAPSYNHLAGVSGIRALDSVSAVRSVEDARPALASRYQGLEGIAAVRTADDSLMARTLSGVAAVRALDADYAVK